MSRYLLSGVIGLLLWTSSWAQPSPLLRHGPLCRTRLTTHRNASDPVLAPAGGSTFAIAYRSGAGGADAVVVALLDDSGAIVTGPVQLVPPTMRAMVMGLAWNDSTLGVLFSQQLGNGQGIFFRLLGADLAPRSGVLRVDEANDSPDDALEDLPAFAGAGGALVWDGEAWGAVWFETPGGPTILPDTVKLSRIAADGRSHGPVFEVSDSSGAALAPALVWTGTDYGVAFVDDRSGANQLHYRRVATDGSSSSPSVAVTALPVGQLRSGPFLGWNGGEIGIAWIDSRDGDRAPYFKRLDASGTPLSAETRLADSPGSVLASGSLTVVWAGDRWAVAAEDFRIGLDLNIEVRLSFATAAGAKLGSDVLVSTPVDPFLSDTPALAFSGATLLAAWRDLLGADGTEIYVQALDATGTPTAARAPLTAGHQPGQGSFLEPEIVTLAPGSYALGWVDQRGARDGGTPTLAFADGSGTLQMLVEPADAVPAQAYDVALAASPDTIAMAWSNASGEVLLSLFSLAGVELGTDSLVNSTYGSHEVSLVWSGSAFVVAWTDNRDGNREIYTAAIAEDGTVLAAANRITDDPQTSRRPAVASTGAGTVVVWEDLGGAAAELAVAPLDASGALDGSVAALTPDDGAASDFPHLASDGAGYAVVYRDATSGTGQVLLQRLDGSGAADAGPTQVSGCLGALPRVAWTEDRWTAIYTGCRGLWTASVDAAGTLLAPERLLLAAPQMSRRAALTADGEQVVLALAAGLHGDDEVLLTSLACATDDTAPACPTSLQAKIEGNDVELRWGAGTDADFALAWHYVYRDGRRIAALPAQVLGFTDPLPPPGPHVYRVTAANQGLVESLSCAETTLSVTLFFDGFEGGDTSAWAAVSPP